MRRTAVHLCLVAGLAGQPATAGPVAVVDDTGHEIRLSEPARRIVSLAPNITETLFTAGAGDRIIAAVDYSDHPEEAARIPRIGSATQLNIEAILGLEPDLVVGWLSGNPHRQITRLRELGLTVYVSEIRVLEDIPRTLGNLGHVAGTQDTASEAVASFNRRLASLRDEHASRPALEVFYQIWDEPLMTINGAHLISDVIRGCGGRNVFADLSSLAPRIDVEAVLARDPAVIVASGMGEERPEWLDDWRRWRELSAVEADNLYFIPPALLQRQTVRILDGMEQLCTQLEGARRRLD